MLMKPPYIPITLEDLNLTEEDTELLISGARHLFKEDIGEEDELVTPSPLPEFYPPVKP
jgi:hypothetical protein